MGVLIIPLFLSMQAKYFEYHLTNQLTDPSTKSQKKEPTFKVVYFSLPKLNIQEERGKRRLEVKL